MHAWRKIRVLLIDDERDLVHALVIRLAVGWGLDVETAADGRVGLDKCRSFKPDVILLDVAMPVMDGWECCRRLRADPETRDIPVILMTAWLSDDLVRRAEALGAARVLVKPFDEDELMGLLRSLPKNGKGR
ncbi:MAG: response regulator [Elusimicrobiota bacterium]